MAGRLLWLSPEYRDPGSEKHTLLISQMELKAATASRDPSFSSVFFFSTNLSRSPRQTFHASPPRRVFNIGYGWVWRHRVSVDLKVSGPSLKSFQPPVSSRSAVQP